MAVIYNTESARAAEAKVLEELERKWKVSIQHMNGEKDQFLCYDGVVSKAGERVGIVEVRCREMTMGTYRTFRIDKAKLDNLEDVARRNKIKAVLVVSLWDKLVGLVPAKDHWPTCYMERKDRGDPLDRDLCYDIPWSAFTLISRRETEGAR